MWSSPETREVRTVKDCAAQTAEKIIARLKDFDTCSSLTLRHALYKVKSTPAPLVIP